MIFIQHGPSWKPKTDEILKMNLAKGIIWDPREENIERIKDIKANNENYRNIINKFRSINGFFCSIYK